MMFLFIFLLLVFISLGTGVLAAYSDIKSLKIPNIYSVVVVCCFVLCYGLMWLFGKQDIFLPLWSHIGAALVIFVVSAALFFMKIMGAADSKLATAYALWIGLGNLPAFLFVMTFCGALLGVVALIIKKAKPFKEPKDGSWVAQLQSGQDKIPYGVPIVIGAVFAFYHVGFLNLQTLSNAFGI